MIVYWLLLLLTAFVAYVFGSLDTMVIASNFFFRHNLRKLGTGNRWLSNFRRIFGVPGFIKLAIAEVIKDLLPILIGGMLLGIKDHADVGRAFACFCLVLGRLYPVFYEFRGSHASLALVVGAFAVNTSAGGAALVVLVAVELVSLEELALEVSPPVRSRLYSSRVTSWTVAYSAET